MSLKYFAKKERIFFNLHIFKNSVHTSNRVMRKKNYVTRGNSGKTYFVDPIP
jgi:hypothetical protein